MKNGVKTEIDDDNFFCLDIEDSKTVFKYEIRPEKNVYKPYSYNS